MSWPFCSWINCCQMRLFPHTSLAHEMRNLRATQDCAGPCAFIFHMIMIKVRRPTVFWPKHHMLTARFQGHICPVRADFASTAAYCRRHFGRRLGSLPLSPSCNTLAKCCSLKASGKINRAGCAQGASGGPQSCFPLQAASAAELRP